MGQVKQLCARDLYLYTFCGDRLWWGLSRLETEKMMRHKCRMSDFCGIQTEWLLFRRMAIRY